MPKNVIAILLFNLFILVLLFIDLGVFHRRSREVSPREALLWSGGWIGLALLFGAGVWTLQGPEAGAAWLAAWLMDKALSVDNLFVFLVIFAYFGVPARDQHRVLFWGILGALVLRGVFIAAGVTLLQTFHWVIYVFGAFLIFTGLKMLRAKGDEEKDLGRNPVLRFLRRHVPMTDAYEPSGAFFVRRAGRLLATPLVAVLVLVETTDLVFAVDSVPAALGITSDAFIVYSSNVMAIVGLRALYFALSGLMGSFRYLNVGLSVILMFVGCKMLGTGVVEIPVVWALGVVVTILAASIGASCWGGRPSGVGIPEEPGESDADADQGESHRVQGPEAERCVESAG